ncbi:MAG: EhaE family protein [Methanomicrobiales archaeon]|nr:EhaE family protein [Methanomicrobiales archaeon]
MIAGYPPEFIIGLLILLVGTAAAAFPRPKNYLTQLINLEIPGWGLLLVMLSYNEALALFTFGAVSVLSTFIYVRVMQKIEVRA